jgi:hypothetical protein
MNLFNKLLLFYNGIRSLYSSIEYIYYFITILHLPYATLIQTYYSFTLLIFMYLSLGTKCVLSNTFLFFISIIQMFIGIIYLGLSEPIYNFILYDLCINICILSIFMIHYNNENNLRKPNNSGLSNQSTLHSPLQNNFYDQPPNQLNQPLDEYNAL